MLPDGMVFLTPVALVTVTKGGVNVRSVDDVESGGLVGWLDCPGSSGVNNVVATINNDTILSTSG